MRQLIFRLLIGYFHTVFWRIIIILLLLLECDLVVVDSWSSPVFNFILLNLEMLFMDDLIELFLSVEIVWAVSAKWYAVTLREQFFMMIEYVGGFISFNYLHCYAFYVFSLIEVIIWGHKCLFATNFFELVLGNLVF